MSERSGSAVRDVFDGAEVREILAETFYERGPAKAGERARKKRKPKKKKAAHYEVICISLYNEDLARLDEKVRRLKAAGHRKMSRSALIRYALDTADLDGLPKAY